MNAETKQREQTLPEVPGRAWEPGVTEDRPAKASTTASLRSEASGRERVDWPQTWQEAEPEVVPRAAVGHGQVATATLGGAGELVLARDSKALVLRIGERLDLSANELVQQAIQSIETNTPERVVVDLTSTRKVFDSGMALLLLLRDRASHLRDRIHLANCAPRVAGRLARAGIASQFRIALEGSATPVRRA